ncbi:hypothetical protein L0222_30715 [bacterium]|nr:hypothetical protein [bacterium]MCI0602213.1 hypothetical protein [bacterium]
MKAASVLLAFLLMTNLAQAQEFWLNLRTGKMYPIDTKVENHDPRISGLLVKGLFKPTGMIENRGKLPEPPSNAPEGWIDLATGQIHFDKEGLMVRSPYLRGWFNGFGGFFVYQKEIDQWNAKFKEKSKPVESITVPLGLEPGRMIHPAPPVPRFTRDLEIPHVHVDYAEVDNRGLLSIRLSVDVENAGLETWGYETRVEVACQEAGRIHSAEATQPLLNSLSAGTTQSIRFQARPRMIQESNLPYPFSSADIYQHFGSVRRWINVSARVVSRFDENDANNLYRLKVMFNETGEVIESQFLQSPGTVAVEVPR